MRDLIASRPKDAKTMEYLVTYSYLVQDSVRELNLVELPGEGKKVFDDACAFIRGNQWLDARSMTELLDRIAGKAPSN